MALGDPYATLAELKARLGVGDTADDIRLTEALASVSREINDHCRRQFNKTTTASVRLFHRASRYVVEVDDFHTTTDLAVATDSALDGTYATAWVSADYQLEPLNGIVNGETGWPYSEVVSLSGAWPSRCRRPAVQVTAQWGWAAVPAPVKEACLILAEETFKLKDAPFGVAGFGEFGPVRVRDNPFAAKKLHPYRRDPILVG